MAKIAIVYYSLKGETIAPDMKVVQLEKGHTAAAEFIQQAVGGDLIELETVKTYAADHMKMIYEAKEELEKGIRPALKSYPDLSGYDVVFLGFPTGGTRCRCRWRASSSIPTGGERRSSPLSPAAAAALARASRI